MSQEPMESLSDRELELLRLLSQGLSNRQIAQELSISHNTVKVHLRNIYGKLHVSSRTEAMMVALRMGWIEVEQSVAEAGLDEDAEDGSLASELTLAGPAEESEQIAAPDEPRLEVEPSELAQASLPQGPVPLTLWQRVYLVLALVLVTLGLWRIWPIKAASPGPFRDRPVQASGWSPAQASRWKSLAQMPTPRSRLAVVVHQGHVYAIGGEAATGVSGAVEVYLPDIDAWAVQADKTTPVANIGAVVLGDRIYVPGGSTGDEQVTERLEIYDPAEEGPGAWSEGRPMPAGLSAYAIATYDDQLYLFGGWDDQSYVATSYKYDPQSDRWFSLTPMKTSRAFAGAGTIGERIYVVGGYTGQEELATCEAYDPAADVWEECPPMNAPRGGVGVAVVADTLYVIGGGWQSYLVENEIFSPGQDTWITRPSPLLREWRNLGVVASGDFIYAMGGWNGEFLGTNQAYRALYRLYVPGTLGQGNEAQKR